MRDYEEAVALIEDHLDSADFEAQPEERVERAELALGVRLPPSYRRFLLELGAGGVGSEEIYGLVNDPPHPVEIPQFTAQANAAIPRTSRRRLPEIPARIRESRNAEVGKRCSRRESPPIPAQAGSARTRLSRRRSPASVEYGYEDEEDRDDALQRVHDDAHPGALEALRGVGVEHPVHERLGDRPRLVQVVEPV
jgi:SMI1-KNR4 cell-wall